MRTRLVLPYRGVGAGVPNDHLAIVPRFAADAYFRKVSDGFSSCGAKASSAYADWGNPRGAHYRAFGIQVHEFAWPYALSSRNCCQRQCTMMGYVRENQRPKGCELIRADAVRTCGFKTTDAIIGACVAPLQCGRLVNAHYVGETVLHPPSQAYRDLKSKLQEYDAVCQTWRCGTLVRP